MDDDPNYAELEELIDIVRQKEDIPRRTPKLPFWIRFQRYAREYMLVVVVKGFSKNIFVFVLCLFFESINKFLFVLRFRL